MLTVFVATAAFPTRAQNGNRDHLSPQESDIVRDTRELDNRIDVLIKMAERRFAVINGTPDPVAKGSMATKSKKKKAEDEIDWGDPPKGTRAELLDDVAGILNEAITNIDDVSRRDEKNPLIGKALHKLAAATKGFAGQMVKLRDQAKKEGELAAIERTAELAQQIIDASSKAPALPSEDSGQKKKKP